jgi:hypothetical protein
MLCQYEGIHLEHFLSYAVYVESIAPLHALPTYIFMMHTT